MLFIIEKEQVHKCILKKNIEAFQKHLTRKGCTTKYYYKYQKTTAASPFRLRFCNLLICIH